MALSRLAGAQANLGAHVTIASLESRMNHDEILAAYSPVIGFEKVALKYLPRGGMIEHLLARQAGTRLKVLAYEHDVIHIHGIWRPLLLQATRVARQVGRPYVISPHGMLSTWSMTQKKMKKQFALSLVWKTALEQAAFLHVLNPDEKRAVSTRCSPNKCVMLPNGVNMDELRELPDTESVWKRFPYLRETSYVVFVGRLHYSKGLDILAHAFAQVARVIDTVHLVVIGPDFGATNTFRSDIRQLGIESRVHVLGGIYGTDKLALLQHASCFCLPSRQEGFSMAIIEAMAMGLPVVISDACHFPEVSTEEAGLVVKLDETAFAQAILRLLTDEATRTRQGANAQHLAYSRYQWKSIAQGFLQAYLSISAGTLRQPTGSA
ncbi:MAG: glycosyltransferase [Nitrospira sp.]|jgi:glycosyltransferase involved in cell wall biosynthesis|nr:glycosyltransferase [Nitrospira sp.]